MLGDVHTSLAYHPWWFDVMCKGQRWRMRVDEFALVRGASEPVRLKQMAERIWEPKFIGEIMAGRDPRVPPSKAETDDVLTVGEFLDRYRTNYVEAEGLKSVDTVVGHLKALKTSLGSLPVTALEKPADITRFKATYREGRRLRRSIVFLASCARRSTGDVSRIHRCCQPPRFIVLA